jgi:UDP-3-O-[3-hydroxymyristoyl] glucosamine N-acyltransferase
VVGDRTRVGEKCVLYFGVRIYHECLIGNECIIHAGAVIGSDGFGFAPQNDQNYKKIPQIGNVILEDRVEIGANVTIDRATMWSTLIQKGVKLDNLNHIAHNVVVGENTVMAAQCGVAGSTRLGKNIMFGGQVGVAPHITIADGVMAAAMSGIAGSVKEEKKIIMGAPAIDISEFRRSFVYYKNLPKLVDRISALEKKIRELEKK